MRRAEIVTAIVLGLFSIYLMWKSGEPPAWDPSVERFANIGMVEGEGPASGWWPFWLSLMMLISSIWIGVNWWRGTSPPSQSDKVFLDSYGRKMLFLVGGSVLAFVGLIHIIGTYFAMFVFLFFYIYFIGKNPIGRTVAISIAAPVVCFFFFDVAMRIVLPKGYSEPLFVPLYEIFL